MSCSQHPALDLAGSYKCLIFTLLGTNFRRNIFAGEVDQVVSRVQGVLIWWWPESCRPRISQPEWKRSIVFLPLFWVCFVLFVGVFLGDFLFVGLVWVFCGDLVLGFFFVNNLLNMSPLILFIRLQLDSEFLLLQSKNCPGKEGFQ